MTLTMTQRELDHARRHLFCRPDDLDAVRDEAGLGHPAMELDVTTRPVSEEWRLRGRKPAFRTAVANVAYILRDSAVADRIGPVPGWFEQRRADLVASGQMQPDSAPKWARDPYEVWRRADAAAVATGDPTAVAAWHLLLELPADIDARAWEPIVRRFVDRHLVRRGTVVAYAVHALRGDDGDWTIAPHAHLVVTARRWRSGRRHGERMPVWAGSWQAQDRLARRWRELLGLARMTDVRRAQSGWALPWLLHKGEVATGICQVG